MAGIAGTAGWTVAVCAGSTRAGCTGTVGTRRSVVCPVIPVIPDSTITVATAHFQCSPPRGAACGRGAAR